MTKPGILRKAKIVATIGPASCKPEKLRGLLKAGMDVARLNFSHGDHSEHAQVIRDLRRLASAHQCPLAVIADLPGPKIRTGRLQDNKPVLLRPGQKLVLTSRDIVGDAARVNITYRHLARDVRPGNRIMLADGSIELRVLARKGQEVICRVVNGGELGEQKGVNLPGANLKISSLTPQDKKHLEFALTHKVDYIAQSFVRSANDVRGLKRLIQRAGYDTPVVAKIEKPEALDDLDAILKVADGVMVARGDLGVEMNLELVPNAQRDIIAQANQERIPVITATQMLESMIENRWPTRAEVSDVSAAIAQGTGAVMLSGETAKGRYPREAVEMMSKVILATEASIPLLRHRQEAGNIAETVVDSVAVAADKFHMRVIVVFTESGYTAQLMSKARPRPPIVAFSPRPEVCSRLALLWGVLPRLTKRVRYVDEFIPEAERRLRQEKLVKKGDVVAIVAGTPLHTQGTTNLIEFHAIGT
jgi:pyruvate kinase